MKKIVTLLFFAGNSFAIFGQYALDWTFNSGGVVIDSAGLNDASAYSMALQTDGKMLVAGNTFNGSNYDFFIARYNNDGSPDLTFDADGKRIIPFSSVHAGCLKVLLQPDGKILLGGYAEFSGTVQGLVMRLESNGAADLTFSGDGISELSFVSDTVSFITSLALQPDGKIIAGGSWNNIFMVLRFETNGNRDMSFVPETFVVGHTDYFVNDVAVQPDGKILAAGTGYGNISAAPPGVAIIVRYNADGSLDTPSGNVFNFAGGPSYATAQTLILQPDGKVLVAGGGHSNFPTVTNNTMGLARFNADLSPDTTFGTMGIVNFDPEGASSYINSMQLQPDGKIITTAFTSVGSNGNISLVRFNYNGTTDTTFGTGGQIITDLGGSELAYTSCLYPDLRIAVAGSIGLGGGMELMIARYNMNGMGVDESNNETVFNVYPNPVSDKMSISSKTIFNNASLKVINFSGQTMLTQQNINGNNTLVDMSNQPSGVYIIELAEKGMVNRTKFIKR